MMRRSNRRLLSTIAAGAALALVAGCGGEKTDTDASIDGDFSGQTLNVAAAWSGAEQANFEKVLDAFEEATGATVNYTSFGDTGPAYLQAQIEGNQPPNVAVISQPALLQSLADAGNLIPLADDVKSDVESNYDQSWVDLGSVDGTLYGIWFKAAHKSTVWYNADLYDEAGAAVPGDWDTFLEQLELINDAGYSGISVGADVGWPLTDWFENIYLRTAGPDLYDQLTNHEIPWTDESVTKALEVMAQLWTSPALQPGGAQRTFPESVTAVFGADPKAATVFEGDFVAGNIAEDGNSTVGENALFYDFPSIDNSAPAVVSGGDAAVQFVDDDATTALMKFLASPEAAEIWIPAGGLLSPNKAVDTSVYPDDTSRQIAESLTAAELLRFDMSDLTPSAFGGTPGQGFWQEMISFYENPSDIAGTQERIEQAAQSAYE